MNKTDQRQLEKMQSQISAFKNGHIGLSSLIGDLVFLRDALSRCHDDWEYDFTSSIADLESAYAYALDKNHGRLERISQRVVDEAIPKILRLIDQFENPRDG